MSKFTYLKYDEKSKKHKEVEIPKEYIIESNGKNIIKHAFLSKIRNELGIEEVNILYPVTPTGDNLQQHVCVVEMHYENSPYLAKDFTAMGECSRLNVGEIVDNKYNERGDIGAMFKASTAYTRAHDRCMRKVLGLHDCFSSSEAKDFHQPGEEFDY